MSQGHFGSFMGHNIVCYYHQNSKSKHTFLQLLSEMWRETLFVHQFQSKIQK